MSSDWTVAINIVLIFFLMFIAKLLKEKLGIFKNVIIPTALLAGFIGLFLGPDVTGLLKFDIAFFEKLIFHFMGIGFIALTLSEQSVKQKGDSIKSGLFIISTYCFQGIIGMLAVLFLIAAIKPELFVGLGLMLPLAYGQGPGFAASIGSSWEEVLSFGFINQYGLTLATVGFLVGGVIGVVMLNYFIRKYKIPVARLSSLKGLQSKELTITSVKEINFFDNLTVQVTWVALIYLATYLTIWGLSSALTQLGELGETVASLVRGFNFLFGIILALLFKKGMEYLSQRGHRAEPLLDKYVMHNIASLSFNIMITASVMAISIQAIRGYWELLLGVALVGAIGTLVFVTWLSRKVFLHNPLHYNLAMFGMLTGTASTGMALLRGIDPDLDTDVAKNFVLGSAVAAPLGIPLMILLGVPIVGFTAGNSLYYYVTFFALLAYTLLMMGLLLFMTRREKKRAS